MRDADEHHLGGLQRRGGAGGFFQTLLQHLPCARQHRNREAFGEAACAAALFQRQVFAGAVSTDHLAAGRGMHGFRQIGQDLRWIAAILVQGIELTQGVGCRTAQQSFEQVENAAAIGEAQHGADSGRGHFARAHGDRLIEDRQAITHRTAGGPRNQRQRIVLGGGVFVGGDGFEMACQQRHVDAPQIEALAPRQNGHRNLAHFGGGEDEFDVRRRFLKRFQQRVEGVLRQHVDFVDDEHLVARDQRLVARVLDDLADVVDAGVGSGVHLQHVGMAALDDLQAMLAVTINLHRRAIGQVGLGIVEGAGNDARRGGFADTAHAGQHIALGDPVGGERVAQRRHHRVLADQLGECLRAILTSKNDIWRGRRAFRRAHIEESRLVGVICRLVWRWYVVGHRRPVSPVYYAGSVVQSNGAIIAASGPERNAAGFDRSRPRAPQMIPGAARAAGG